MALIYGTANLAEGTVADAALVRALQLDLRGLGYLAGGIDGQFGPHTTQAVRRLQFDLLHNTGQSTHNDGSAPVAITTFNQGDVVVNGRADEPTAASIDAMLNAATMPRIPSAADPAAANKAALQSLAVLAGSTAPLPFMLAIFKQESQCDHYEVPLAGETDGFVVLGLDTAQGQPDQIASRGYGIGQVTLFHHPPQPNEVAGIVSDPVANTTASLKLLRRKFDTEIISNDPNARADDRYAEHPLLDLRLCKYRPGDPKYLTDCAACAAPLAKLDITPDTPCYPGANFNYGPASAYANPSYSGVPDRSAFPCDWPYAVRRYNGSGSNSYNYQAIVLRNLLTPPATG
jgi:peptidoglycan hydrolase-like protein with peptidoglycan-binding domain